LKLLERLGFELYANELMHADSDHSLLVLNGLEEFREHLGGELAVTLLRAIGEGFEAHEVRLPQVIEAIYELQARQGKRVEVLRATG
jgi:3-dehydroquinate synthase